MAVPRRRLSATLIFLAFTAPLGIAAHLIAELAGLGWHDDAGIAFSARHAYLAILAIGAIGGLLPALHRVPPCERSSRIAELIDDLPFRGRGVGFTLLLFFAQFAFFAVTQIGEGCPLCGGDVVVGVFAAAIAAFVGACAVALGKRRVLEFVLALAFACCTAFGSSSDLAQSALSRRIVLRATRRRTPFAFRYRPPPPVRS